MRLVEHLNHDAVGIGAVEGRAAVAMRLERMDDANAFYYEFLFKLFYPLDTFYHKADVVELFFLCACRKIRRDAVEREIIAARRQIYVVCIRFPHHFHAEDFPIEAFGARHIPDLQSYVAHPCHPRDPTHGRTIA